MTTQTIIFFRSGYFYPTEYPTSYSNWAAEAARNPGTLRIETIDGKVLWKAPEPGAVGRTEGER